MNNDIPLKFYDIADEYATEAAKPVSDTERDALAHYFQQLITRLMNNEEISEEAQAGDGNRGRSRRTAYR